MLRSTSGVAEFFGKSPIEFGSSTQSVRALSTGESEFYAITKGSAHSLHSQAILKAFGVVVEAVVLSDASAGIGIASRQGCGRLKPSRSQVALGAGESIRESIATSQASHGNQHR